MRNQTTKILKLSKTQKLVLLGRPNKALSPTFEALSKLGLIYSHQGFWRLTSEGEFVKKEMIEQVNSKMDFA